MKDKTVTATLTQEQVDMIVKEDIATTEAMEQLERMIGTYETYGTWNIVRPNYSEKANLNVSFERN